jgi:hypothetical protein
MTLIGDSCKINNVTTYPFISVSSLDREQTSPDGGPLGKPVKAVLGLGEGRPVLVASHRDIEESCGDLLRHLELPTCLDFQLGKVKGSW